MTDRPRLARDIYQSYVTDDGEVRWPDDAKERIRLGRALLGRQWMVSFDYWLDHALDLLENPAASKPFARNNERQKEDKYFRDGLSTLSREQRKAVWDLIRTVTQSMLFSTLVDLDQGRAGDYVLLLHPRDGNADTVQISSDGPDDLHDDLLDWILSFSKYGREIAELVEVKGGWQFKPKAFYNT